MTKSEKLIPHPCPHCGDTELYPIHRPWLFALFGVKFYACWSCCLRSYRWLGRFWGH